MVLQRYITSSSSKCMRFNIGFMQYFKFIIDILSFYFGNFLSCLRVFTRLRGFHVKRVLNEMYQLLNVT